MAGSTLRRSLTVVARALLLAVIAAPPPALAQENLDELADRQREIVAAIEQEESLNGPFSEELIAPLTALSLFYEETGDYALADATIDRLLQVIRANYGLYSLEQAPSIQRLIAHEEERGNAESAWMLEQELLALAGRNRDDLRIAPILRDSGDKRMEILDRYDAGELPLEVILGCYYNDSQEYLKVQRRGSRPLMTAPGHNVQNSCGAGSRRPCGWPSTGRRSR